jgi:UDP-N-acetylglucosamine--N-acetylmuramyl-(pentapeptide) pyrophosphoryl-undecaprenol N-acetylglucosamine transferase
MKEKPIIIFTGGGSAGHVTPNIAVIKKLQQKNWQIFYIGSKKGIEKELITNLNISYFQISTGKLRRYFSWYNFIDPIKIFFGVIQAFFICRKIKPQVIFSKGGFVAFPVVVAAWLNRIPVIIHESDLTPGLANKLSFPFAKQICVTFPDTQQYIKKKVIVTGTPIREELFSGNANKGLQLCEFTNNKKIILIYAGGLGSKNINNIIRSLLPKLLIDFQIVHICGKHNIDNNLLLEGYKQFEYLHAELADIMACANMVISRAGANSIYELLTLQKPHILIPLPKTASRGDQIVNAEYSAAKGFSQVIPGELLTANRLYEQILWVMAHEQELINNLTKFKKLNSIDLICDILFKYV